NGNARYQKPVKQNERLRLRLINTSNARIFSLLLNGLEGWVVALDGQPIETPFEESKPLDRLSLAPAQRIDLIVDVTAEEGTEGVLYMPGRNGDHTLAVFSVDGKARPAPLPTPKPLARNPIPEIDSAAQARKVFLHMEGGAMGQMRGAFLGGKRVGMRELVNAGKVWAFNGQVEMPEKPLISAARGETLHIEIKNDTSWPHAMHLHGFHFRKLAENGRFGPLRDTLLMDREETATIAFVADNPGKWLLHCHMLEHVSSGMMTWIEVA
ncbi:MAG: multicopper oxidase domain-containing protein, partial [Rhodospirillaceae bacterium]|nr:multicopper oxidase domain-containing protein [Rhodospirillaceae bacterium]